MTNQRPSQVSVLAAFRDSGARNSDGTELQSLRPRKRARPDPHASDPDLGVPCPKPSTGSWSILSPPFPRITLKAGFSYLEDDLPTDLSRIYQRLIKGKRHGRFSATSHQLWDAMAVKGGLRGLTSTTGYIGEDFVAKASHQFSQLVASILTDIDAFAPMVTIRPTSLPLCMSCSTPQIFAEGQRLQPLF
ncbi:hypothetical protein K438DRAFT_1965681 [Mycena galopus ATCC 62051]|nr:hypothetical protein K438DRAFT_1965681 [Mycena galopus ATCC 62051]